MSLKIKRYSGISILSVLYVVFVLFIPGNIKHATTVYHILGSDYFSSMSSWLNYYYCIFELLCILFVFCIKPQKWQVNVLPVIGYVFICNLIRALFGATSIFIYNDYSIILSMLTAYGLYILGNSSISFFSLDDWLDIIIILNFFTQLINLVEGNNVAFEGGRYAALNSDYGTVGTFCAMYLVYFLFIRKEERRSLKSSFVPLCACILSLFLSGSRSNLYFVIVFTIIFSFRLKSGMEMGKGKKRAIIAFSLILAIVLALIFSGRIQIPAIEKLLIRTDDALTAFFGRNSEYYDDNTSFNSRILSILTGLTMISNNIFGISCSTIDLQSTSIYYGYPTFPHSSLICYYLLWGIPAIIIFIDLIRKLIISIMRKNNIFILITYLIALFLLYGGPIVNIKTYYWYLLIFGLINREMMMTETTDDHITIGKKADRGE